MLSSCRVCRRAIVPRSSSWRQQQESASIAGKTWRGALCTNWPTVRLWKFVWEVEYVGDSMLRVSETCSLQFTREAISSEPGANPPLSASCQPPPRVYQPASLQPTASCSPWSICLGSWNIVFTATEVIFVFVFVVQLAARHHPPSVRSFTIIVGAN